MERSYWALCLYDPHFKTVARARLGRQLSFFCLEHRRSGGPVERGALTNYLLSQAGACLVRSMHNLIISPSYRRCIRRDSYVFTCIQLQLPRQIVESLLWET